MGKLTEKLGLALVFSIVVWLGATVFFMLFGSAVLTEPGQDGFMLRFLLLEAGTFALLYAVMLVYRRVTKRGLRRLSLALWGRLSVCFSTLFLYGIIR